MKKAYQAEGGCYTPWDQWVATAPELAAAPAAAELLLSCLLVPMTTGERACSRASRASSIEKQQLCEKIVGKTAMERELLDDLNKISLHTKIFAKNRENDSNVIDVSIWAPLNNGAHLY